MGELQLRQDRARHDQKEYKMTDLELFLGTIAVVGIAATIKFVLRERRLTPWWAANYKSMSRDQLLYERDRLQYHQPTPDRKERLAYIATELRVKPR
jgi:hypothetical protein